MEYQVIKENGEIKFVVLPVDYFNSLMEKLEDESDLKAIQEAINEPLYVREEAEDYIFMNPVKRERQAKGWTQNDLAKRLGVKQSTIAKWERKGAVYQNATRHKLANVFGLEESAFLYNSVTICLSLRPLRL